LVLSFSLSVCPSVAYTANNWRTRRPTCPNSERRFHTFEATRIPVSRSKGQRSKVKVTRPINADTHPAPYLPNCKAYELQPWYTDGGRRVDDPRQSQAPRPPRSKVKVVRSRDQSEPSLANAVPVSLAAGGAYCVGRTRRPHYLFHVQIGQNFLLSLLRIKNE